MIEVLHINKKFGENTVFEDFSIVIPTRDFVVFAGNSGCGKTTLLNMIGGLEKPDSGQIIIDGTDIYKNKSRKQFFANKVGFLFQNFALIENKTVRENLLLVNKANRTDITVKEALGNVGIVDKADVKVYKLSGGEQQRVALARLMLKKCDIILADEPTGSLDESNAEIVMNSLYSLNEQGKTVIIVTHNEKIIANSKKVVTLNGKA